MTDTITPETSYVHPALLAVRQTPEHVALCAEFNLAAAQTYGGLDWRLRQRAAQSAIQRLEREAIDNWGAGISYRATCTHCDAWTVPLAYGKAAAWTLKHAERCADAQTEVWVCGEDGRARGQA